MNEGKNGESEPQKEPAEKPKLNEEQYELLLDYSKNRQIDFWNDYREEHPDEEIRLRGADLHEADLESADLRGADLESANLQRTNLESADLLRTNLESADLQGADLKYAWLGDANLQNANLEKADLQGARLHEANLQGANFWRANLRGTDLAGANLQGAYLGMANLQGAKLNEANLQDANLLSANLQGASFREANLESAYLLGVNLQYADLWGANLQDTKLWHAELQGTDFTTAIVDGETLIWECKVNRYSKSGRFTDFEGVGLDSVRIDPEAKQLLEYNVRRKNWEEWYSKHLLLKWPVCWFWAISDYGLSSVRIMLSFILLTVIFATIYFTWGWVDYYLFGIKDEPGIVKNLFIAPQAQQQISDFYYCSMIYFRSVCFSVATMFSFGDISTVNTQFGWKWWFGHLIPIVQMVTGYMLLGALITRFAVLFTSGGPAGKFVPMDEETKQFFAKLEEDKEKADKM